MKYTEFIENTNNMNITSKTLYIKINFVNESLFSEQITNHSIHQEPGFEETHARMLGIEEWLNSIF